MNTNENITPKVLERDERISRFLKGDMNPTEEEMFFIELETDEQLKQDAIIQARLIRGMRQVDEELIRSLKATSAQQINQIIKPRKFIFIKSVKTWLSIAASITILIGAGYKGYDYYNTTRLGMQYAKIFPMQTIVRGDIDADVDKELQELFYNIIESKNLNETTNRLAELWEIANKETYNDYTDYAPYIGWYLAIGYLENYEKEKAKIILNSISKDTTINNSLKSHIEKLLIEF